MKTESTVHAPASDCKIKAKEIDHIMFCYVRGIHIAHIAPHMKRDVSQIHQVIWEILRGDREFTPTWSCDCMDACDWSLREEYILRFMRIMHRKPIDVSALLGRSKSTIKRKWIEMQARDEFARQQRIADTAETTRLSNGGVTDRAPEKQSKQSAGFGL